MELSAADREDMGYIDDLTQSQIQIMRMWDKEAELVETEKWNVNVVEQLLSLLLTAKWIPSGKQEELFNLRPTLNDPPLPGDDDQKEQPQTSAKEKERAIDPPTKRSIYQVLPANAKESWLGEYPGESGTFI